MSTLLPAVAVLSAVDTKISGGLGYLADGTAWEDAIQAREEFRSLMQRCKKLSEHDGVDCSAVEELARLGHHQPLGSSSLNRESLDEYTSDNLPSPELFWRRHVGGRPAVFRGLAEAHPAFTKWSDDVRLAKMFGNLEVKVEPQQEERLSDHCARREVDPESGHHGIWVDGRGQQPLHTVPCPPNVTLGVLNGRVTSFSKFLATYRQKSSGYVITQLPTQMAHDVLVPEFMQCGSRPQLGRHPRWPWLTQFYEANLWMSSSVEGMNQSCIETEHTDSARQNMSRSVLHYDQNHGFMCLYSGMKEWIHINSPLYLRHLPMWEGNYNHDSPHDSANSDDSLVDGEFVDLVKYPQAKHVKFSRTLMRPGDCVFTPAQQLHYVRSWSRNVASMVMMQTTVKFDPHNCPASQKSDAAEAGVVPLRSVPLGECDLVWNFPGLVGQPEHGLIKMGWPDWTTIRNQLARVARKLNRKNASGLTKRRWVVVYRKIKEIVSEGDQLLHALTADDAFEAIAGSGGRRTSAPPDEANRFVDETDLFTPAAEIVFRKLHTLPPDPYAYDE